MRNLIRLIPAFLLGSLSLLFLAGCQSISQPKGSSAGYATFKFYERAPVGDQRFEEPSALKDRATQEAIRSAFQEHGLAYSRNNPDLVVSYLFIKQDNVGTQTVPTYYGADYQKIQSVVHQKGVLDQPDMGYFKRGAIVIDIMDVKAKKLVYRDFAVRDLQGATDPDALSSLIESAVNEALEDFLN